MKLYTKKNGWEKHIGFRWPRANWYGLMTLIIMCSILIARSYCCGITNEPFEALNIWIQIFSTLFLLKGFVYFYLHKEEKEE